MRQTDVRQKHRLMSPPIRGGGIISNQHKKSAALTLSWLSITPFGSPVVPDYITQKNDKHISLLQYIRKMLRLLTAKNNVRSCCQAISMYTFVCFHFSAADFRFGQASHLSNTISRHHLDTVSDEDLYAVNFAAELLCLRDQSYILANDVVLNKDDLNDLLSVVLCE